MRTTAIYSGNVQGVGFRFTTLRIAANYKVTGTVKNLSDGKVEVIAEGLKAEVEMFLDELNDRMSGHIRNTKQHSSPGTGQYSSFNIDGCVKSQY